MGTAITTIPTGSPTQILQTNRNGLATISNIGSNVVYLDHVSNVSSFSFDKRVPPGLTVGWADGLECWAIADPLGPSQLDISYNVTNFASAAIGGNGSPGATVLYSGPLSGLRLPANAINVSGYQSVKIYCITQATTPATPSFLSVPVKWVASTGILVASPPIMDSDETFLPASTTFFWQMTLDVKSPAFYIPYALAPAYVLEPQVAVLGYAARQPQSVSSFFDTALHPGNFPFWIDLGGPLPAAPRVAMFLPLWSGQIQIELNWNLDAAAAPVPYAILGDREHSTAAFTMGGLAMTPVQTSAAAPGQYRGVWTISGGRRQRILSIYPGAGYATFEAWVGISYIGSEDN